MAMPPLAKLNCKYGAPMGRRESHELAPEIPHKFHPAYVPFIDGCYDQGGAYWGLPANLYRVYCQEYSEADGRDLLTEYFVRAGSREQAKALVRKDYPSATFYR